MSQKLISGFTFIKNGIKLGYPVLESIKSIDPICDEVVINVGYDQADFSDGDGTYELLRDHLTGDRYKFIQSQWSPELKTGGLILSEQTNIALAKCQGKYCQYIQGDEAVHEEDLKLITDGVALLEKRSDIDGLIFRYMHFYGNVDIFKYTRNIYRREVRLIRNHKGIQSWRDAQGFRHNDESKINAKQIEARVFHYGWARADKVMKKKVNEFGKLYHGDSHTSAFEYDNIYGLYKFLKTHPAVMDSWITNNRNEFDIFDRKYKRGANDLGLYLCDLLERATGYRLGEFKNFKEVR